MKIVTDEGSVAVVTVEKLEDFLVMEIVTGDENDNMKGPLRMRRVRQHNAKQR